MTPYEQNALAAALVFGVIGSITGVWGLLIAWRNHRRETERHDVVWVGEWANTCKYVLTNTGTSTAEKVNAVVNVVGCTERAYSDKVPGGGSLEFEFVDMAVIAQLGSPFRQIRHEPDPVVTESVTWFTKLGTERKHQFEAVRKVPLR